MRIFRPLPLATWAALTAITLTACQPPNDHSAQTSNVANKEVPKPRLPVADPPLDRARLLQAIAEARSAAGLGQDDRSAQRQLDGKRFELRVRFGCIRDAVTDVGPFNVKFDAEQRTLRLRAAPNVAGEPWVAERGGSEIESVEGFWIPRPWLLTDGCPVSEDPQESQGAQAADAAEGVVKAEHPPASLPVAVGAPRTGIAQLFARSDARTGRRNQRAYEATVTLTGNERPSEQGYTLILSGRLKEVGDGRVIICRSLRPDRPPDCVVSASFDRVRFEAAGGGAVLAEWSS